MILLIIFVIGLYGLLIAAFYVGYYKVPIVVLNSTVPKIKFSIVVAFRNEANNLPELLKSIMELNYPAHLFEILLVNDGSTDDFESIIRSFRMDFEAVSIQLLHSKGVSNSPKKEALQLGISHAKFDYIVTTDADCLVPKEWLKGFNQNIIENETVFMAGAVSYKNEDTFLGQYQQLNLMSLIGVTMGGFGLKLPIMCNGANLCFSKKVFLELGGYSGNETIASGDDVFLLEKINAVYPQKISYLKSNELIVKTASEKKWNSFVHQQLRWASKTKAYKSLFTKFVGLLVFASNLSFVILLVLTCFNSEYLKLLCFLALIKIGVDSLLLLKTARFFHQKINSINYLVSVVVYPFFNVFIGISSQVKKYAWKERKFSS